MNRGVSSTPSYLWTKAAPAAATHIHGQAQLPSDPIVELAIVSSASSDEGLPRQMSSQGFERLAKNLLRGSLSLGPGSAPPEAYLCVRRGRDEDPIAEICVYYTAACPAGFEAVPQPVLACDAAQIRLCFKRASKGR